MRFSSFTFKNFKGISNQKINFNKAPSKNVFTFVGLNESGKTTILEAINYFAYKSDDLKSLDIDNYSINDISDLIPINLRDNFNDVISIRAVLEIDENDKRKIKEEFRKHDIILTDCGKEITYEQTYPFENSIYTGEHKWFWGNQFKGRKKTGRKTRSLTSKETNLVYSFITTLIPNILYFPNFLFEFPEKVYLNSEDSDKKMSFYRLIIQDLLDSLDNGLFIDDHLIKRITSNEDNERRNLVSLIGKMQKKLTSEIFSSWNQIFNKKIENKEIILEYGMDKKGVYLEFNIKDDVDIYRITERSLGFRWFFVYILLTRFRSYRQTDNSVFFLFDEPASNLHPSAQNELLKSFEKLPYVLYTTHSHYLINPLWLENTYVIKNEAIDYDHEEEYSSKNTDIRINTYREFSTRHPNQSNYFQPILEVLDYSPSNLELVPDVIFTEGKNDFYTLSYISFLLFRDDRPKIIPGTSASNLSSLISLYIGWSRNFVTLLDSDSEGIKQKKRYSEIFGKIVDNKIFDLSDVESSWKHLELEGLFETDDRLKIIQSIHPERKKYGKKIFNQCIQELLVNKVHIELTKATLDRFELLIKFLLGKLQLESL